MKKHRKFTELLDEYLKDEEFAAEFLSQALEEENYSTFLLSLKDLMRVHGTVTSVTLSSLTAESSNP